MGFNKINKIAITHMVKNGSYFGAHRSRSCRSETTTWGIVNLYWCISVIAHNSLQGIAY